MKSVSLLALQATAKGDALKLNATGVVSDDETAEPHGGRAPRRPRGLAPRGAGEVAGDGGRDPQVHRLARQDDGLDRGTLPGAAVRALAEKKHAHVD